MDTEKRLVRCENFIRLIQAWAERAAEVEKQAASGGQHVDGYQEIFTQLSHCCARTLDQIVYD